MLPTILADGVPSWPWLPHAASAVAPSVDGLFNFVLFINVFFVALITILLVVFVLKYRHRPGHTDHTKHAGHSTALELTWTIIPLIIVLIIYLIGFKGYMHMAEPPDSADQILATGQMWNWSFTYPNGYTDPDLHLRRGVPVKITLQSQDVIHDLFVPDFRVKKDDVPGRWNTMWFTPTEDGEFEIYCAAYCGTKHSQMRAKCYVQEPADFQKWLDIASDWTKTTSPLAEGKKLYAANCASCHSTDEAKTVIVGPPWRDLIDSQQPLEGGGTVYADDTYVRTGVWDPSTFHVAGIVNNVMPSFKGRLSPTDIGAILDYMKTISTYYKGDTSSFDKIQAQTTAPATQPATAPAAAPSP